MVGLQLDNGTAKAYLCNLGGTTSLFSRLACHILNLANKHDITIIPSYVHTHLNGKSDYQSWGRLITGWYLFPYIAQGVLQLWGQLEVDLLAF